MDAIVIARQLATRVLAVPRLRETRSVEGTRDVRELGRTLLELLERHAETVTHGLSY